MCYPPNLFYHILCDSCEKGSKHLAEWCPVQMQPESQPVESVLENSCVLQLIKYWNILKPSTNLTNHQKQVQFGPYFSQLQKSHREPRRWSSQSRRKSHLGPGAFSPGWRVDGPIWWHKWKRNHAWTMAKMVFSRDTQNGYDGNVMINHGNLLYPENRSFGISIYRNDKSVR